MGRKKLDRVIPLYTRITKKNNDFIKMLCKKSRMSKTEWLDKHIAFLRNNLNNPRVVEELVKETRNGL